MLGEAKGALCLGESEITLVLLPDVAELKFGIDEMVAGIHAAVMFERQSLAADGSAGAQLRWQTQ